MNLREVKEGLAKGESFKRPFGRKGWEYVRPLSDGYFEHTVVGSDWGGCAELHITIMTSDRWDDHGWMPEHLGE